MSLANRYTCLTSQTIFGPCGQGFIGHFKNIPLADPNALPTSLTFIPIHMDQIDFKVPELSCHKNYPDSRKPRPLAVDECAIFWPGCRPTGALIRNHRLCPWGSTVYLFLNSFHL